MSRIITQNAINAFLVGSKFSSSNTTVTIENKVIVLSLFGNNIAYKYPDGKIKITNAGYFTKTTQERLNGLPDVHIQQKKKVWYLNGNQWDGKLTEIN